MVFRIDLPDHLNEVVRTNAYKDKCQHLSEPEFKGFQLVEQSSHPGHSKGQQPGKDHYRDACRQRIGQAEPGRGRGNDERYQHGKIEHPAVGTKRKGKDQSQKKRIPCPEGIPLLKSAGEPGKTRDINAEYTEHVHSNQQQKGTDDPFGILLKNRRHLELIGSEIEDQGQPRIGRNGAQGIKDSVGKYLFTPGKIFPNITHGGNVDGHGAGSNSRQHSQQQGRDQWSLGVGIKICQEGLHYSR